MSSGTSSGMACYKCDSHNYSDPNCDDPIHPAYMKLEDNCQVPKQNHIGTFPAAFCVKIIGESENVYLLGCSVPTLILWVVEFSNVGYKIRKVFCLRINILKGN